MLEVQHAAAGGWLAVVAAGRLLVVNSQDAFSTADIRALWDSIARPDGLRTSLESLTKKGLSATPPFALVEWEGDPIAAPASVRCILRGDVSLSLDTVAGDRDLSGAAVSTWFEQSVSGVTGFRLQCGDAPQVSDAVFLPLAEGASWVSGLRLGSYGEADADHTVVLPPRAAATPAQVPTAEVPVVDAAEPPAAPEPTATPDSHEERASEETIVEAPCAEGDAAPGDAVRGDAEASIDEQSGYDHLFGATQMRSVEDAAVRAGEEAEPDEVDVQSKKIDLPAFVTGADPLGEAEGDHDGLTVFSGDIQKLRKGRKAKRDASGKKKGADAPGEDNAAPEAPKSPDFYLTLMNGTKEYLGQPVLIGRAPSVSKVSGGHMPRLVTVGSADQDISRNHVQLSVEGDTVVVTDLHSRNGTIVVLPGKAPQKLRQGEPTSVIVGTVVDLGGGVSMTVCEE
ncbi:FHA domain-containing protein [Leifsonia sp. Root112D2]|uniref:FHA domain-containing protein n=1 Tax=Leifsonia sp. Root112D2 TaxID=1736426 RepID=UPI0006FC2839|nr:FHA domain-containing protein [Leifsonia sp. Root112D2]KQV07659.1 hypothetical protein ASC63_10600 [Leifsonia sp. Root112D2]